MPTKSAKMEMLIPLFKLIYEKQTTNHLGHRY